VQCHIFVVWSSEQVATRSSDGLQQILHISTLQSQATPVNYTLWWYATISMSAIACTSVNSRRVSWYSYDRFRQITTIYHQYSFGWANSYKLQEHINVSLQKVWKDIYLFIVWLSQMNNWSIQSGPQSKHVIINIPWVHVTTKITNQNGAITTPNNAPHWQPHLSKKA